MTRIFAFFSLLATLFGSLLGLSTGCNQTSDTKPTTGDPAAPAALATPRPGGRISGAQARQLVKDGALLLDVRTTGEFGGNHLNGALNIPVQVLPTQTQKLPAKDAPIVVYCLSGARSSGAVRTLTSMGYTKVYDLGAIRNW